LEESCAAKAEEKTLGQIFLTTTLGQKKEWTEMLTKLLLLQNWSHEVPRGDSAKRLTAKFKSLRKAIKDWQRSFSSLKNTITNIKLVTQFLDLIEEFRDLSLEEWNFRVILKKELLSLLEQQKTYWKQ
jgi:hypothetical protein